MLSDLGTAILAYLLFCCYNECNGQKSSEMTASQGVRTGCIANGVCLDQS
jgi:hypothetical protein